MSNTNQELLKISGLKTVIKVRNGEIVPVDDVDICVPPHSTVGIVGESGCGKSMTAMSIMGLLPKNVRIASGSINLNGTELTGLSQKEMRKITGDRMSIIFQEPMTSLNPVITAGKQVREAITLHRKVSKDEAKKMVIEMFKSVGIPEPERRYNSYPHELSGGLRQRVMIAMAMVCEPELLIADEPTTALDVTIQAQILQLIRELQKELGMSVIYITHDLGVVANVADRVAVMYAGQIVEYGTVEEIFYDAWHPYTWALLSSMPQMGVKGEDLFNIQGTPPNLFAEIRGDAFAPRNPQALKIDFVKQPPYFDVTPTHKAKTWLLDPRAPRIEPPAVVRRLREEGM